MTNHNPDNRIAVAERLTAYRLSLGLNKADFATSLDISEQSYGSFENCTRDLSLTAAKKLYKHYGLSLDFLYFGGEAMAPPAPVSEPGILPALERYLVQKPKDAQKRILTALKALEA